MSDRAAANRVKGRERKAREEIGQMNCTRERETGNKWLMESDALAQQVLPLCHVHYNAPILS